MLKRRFPRPTEKEVQSLNNKLEEKDATNHSLSIKLEEPDATNQLLEEKLEELEKFFV